MSNRSAAKIELFWGHLDYVKQADEGEGLIEVQLSGQDANPIKVSISSEIEGKLQGLIGQKIVIGHILNEWYCGVDTS